MAVSGKTKIKPSQSVDWKNSTGKTPPKVNANPGKKKGK